MWNEKDTKLEKEFSFPDFKAALNFVNKVGELAEQEQHHPDIELGWGRVSIQLTTHSENAVTDKDRKLAKLIDELQ